MSWPTLPAFLEELANTGNLTAMGSTGYNLTQSTKIMGSMAFVKTPYHLVTLSPLTFSQSTFRSLDCTSLPGTCS